MQPRQKLVILGTHVFAEEVADLVGDGDAYQLAAFAENWDRGRCPGGLLGRPVLWVDDLPPLAGTHLAVCALGTTKRRAFIEQVAAMGFRFATVLHPAARVSTTSRVGEGSILSVGAVVAAHTRVGRHVIVNRGALLGHHAAVGDYVTISPGANVAGKVRVGDGAFLGMGAVVLDGVQVGAGSVVAAGSVVTRDVPERVQVMGVPAKITKEGVEGR
jgi:sugar O-acyltransferase (sialic acid O-acetyltransferase NeuD family)